MTDAPTLVSRAKKFAEARGLKLTTVSKRLFADHRRIAAIDAGESFLRPPTLQRALAKMDELEGVTREDARATETAASDAP